MANFQFLTLFCIAATLAFFGNAHKINEVPSDIRVAHEKTSHVKMTYRMPRIRRQISLNTVVRQDDEEYYDDSEEDYADEYDDDDDEEDSEESYDDYDDYEDETPEEETEDNEEEPAPAPKTLAAPASKLHLEYTANYPKSCACKLATGLHNGVCWKFDKPGSDSCASHTCKPSYICVDGTTTGLRCIRKLNTQTIVSNGDGTCTKKSTSSYGYVLYSGR